jgi:hypothetical protein
MAPSDIVGVHYASVEEPRQARGEGRLADTRPAVHEDEG